MSLNLVAEQELFLGLGNVSLVAKAGDLLFLRVMRVNHPSRLVIADAATLAHIQTITLKPGQDILNAFAYDANTLVIKTRQLPSPTTAFYVLTP